MTVMAMNKAIQIPHILAGFGVHVAKTPTYAVVYLFPVFVALCDHNPPTLQTDRQTDGRRACSI